MATRMNAPPAQRPTSLRRRVRNLWEQTRDWLDLLALGVRSAVSAARPTTLLYFGYAPGDDLLCTALLREWRKRGRDGLMMISNHDALFVGNGDPAFVRPLWKRYSSHDSTVAICTRFAKITGAEFKSPHYAPPIPGEDRSAPPSRHIIAELCASAGIAGPVAIRPYLTLSEEERAGTAWARGRIVIQSGGMSARHPIRNKQWSEERFQGVVDALATEAEFIQLGAPGDPPLRGTKDLRGKTSIRETAAILANAQLFVGTVGFPMHLARAVECPSVIIFGGREAPWQSGYICNINLYSAVPCAPCWRWNSCDLDRKCMSDIAVGDVVAAIRQMLDRPRGPLAVETVEIGPEEPPHISMQASGAETAATGGV